MGIYSQGIGWESVGRKHQESVGVTATSRLEFKSDLLAALLWTVTLTVHPSALQLTVSSFVKLRKVPRVRPASPAHLRFPLSMGMRSFISAEYPPQLWSLSQ